MPQFRIRVDGVEDVMRTLGSAGAEQFAREIDQLTELNTREMANKAHDMAPHLTGKLKGGIVSSVNKIGEGHWEFGDGGVEYSQKQEYEHKSKKGFFRKAVWNGRTKFRRDIVQKIAEWR